MKQVLIFWFCLSLGWGIKAGHNHSDFQVSLNDGGAFSVVFDNYAYPEEYNSFFLSDLDPGSYRMKIFRFYFAGWNCPPKKKMVYNGWVQIPPASILHGQIDCYGNFITVFQGPKFPPPPPPVCAPVYYPSCGGGHYGHGHSCGGYGPGYGSNMMPMNIYDFQNLKNTLAGISFDRTRLQVAQQAVAGNYFTAGQVAEMMRLFSFESNRLDLAKFAWSKTVDRQNYYLVNNAFTFSSSVQELNKYIATQS
jgi:hypothetical protein